MSKAILVSIAGPMAELTQKPVAMDTRRRTLTVKGSVKGSARTIFAFTSTASDRTAGAGLVGSA
jgi:hypothetical protein